jgi:isopentenyldiphosphate isomerase
MSVPLDSGFEAVYTVLEYYDGPRSGVADFKGKPHFYQYIFDDSRGRFSDEFSICPIDQQTFQLALEDWNIWLRWEEAFHSGKTPHATHPALPEDRDRHSELTKLLADKLVLTPANTLKANGNFKVREKGKRPGELALLQVKWSEVNAAQNAGEIFDVVNDRDEVIGQQTRGEVHRLGLKHRAVHVLVFNRRGEVFLQKRSLRKDTSPGAWDSSASGHLDAGEDYDVCAVRELHEEIGLKTVAAPVPLFKINARPETGQEFVWVYRLEAEGPFTLHPDEIETGGWFAPEKVTSWMAGRPQDFAKALLLIWKLFHAPR